jgi:hypothetical protein
MTEHGLPLAPSAAARSRCRFCQTTTGKRSKEHVLRKSYAGRIWTHPSSFYTYAVNGELQTSRRVNKSAFEMEVNEVCEECNNGWLERLEEEVDRMVIDLSRGRVPDVDEDAWDRLAFWMVLRALLRTLEDKDQSKAPRFLFQHVYKTRQIPEGFIVQWARADGYFLSAGRSSMMHRATQIGRPDIHHFDGLVTFGIQKLFFQVFMCGGSIASQRATIDSVLYVEKSFPDTFNLIHPEREKTLARGTVPSHEAALVASNAPARNVTNINPLGVTRERGAFGEPLR